MADLEFDYWPLERLQQLTQCLRSHSDASNPLSLPSSTNTAFWKRAAKSCGLDDNDDEVAEELAEAVTSDFASRELFLVKPGLWLGALCSTESRLLLCHLEVKSICTLASHPIDELWSEDGIEYLTGIVSAVSPVRGQLDACVGFLRANEPDAAIVCCSSGIGVSALVASAVVATCGVMDAASAIESVRQAVGCAALDISPADIADLRQFLSMTPLTPTLRPSVPKAGDELSPMSKLASQMAGKRARDAEQSTPLKPTPPAARPDERAAGLVITA